MFLNCPHYEDLHHELFNQAFELNSEFYSLNDDEKLIFLLITSNMIKIVTKTCKDILDRRRRFFLINITSNLFILPQSCLIAIIE